MQNYANLFMQITHLLKELYDHLKIIITKPVIYYFYLQATLQKYLELSSMCKNNESINVGDWVNCKKIGTCEVTNQSPSHSLK
jgi:hypothetical protein